jgi:Fe-S cluster assembly iron-binding protein IscA
LGLALDEPNESEQAVQVNGIDVLISDSVKDLVNKKTIDYVDSSYSRGFTISAAGKSCC